jgi:hypothetical protein
VMRMVMIHAWVSVPTIGVLRPAMVASHPKNAGSVLSVPHAWTRREAPNMEPLRAPNLRGCKVCIVNGAQPKPRTDGTGRSSR